MDTIPQFLWYNLITTGAFLTCMVRLYLGKLPHNMFQAKRRRDVLTHTKGCGLHPEEF